MGHNIFYGLFLLNYLFRSKVDMNRDIIEGTQGNPVAIVAYQVYHDYIKRAKAKENRGILFDLHGQVCTPLFENKRCIAMCN